MFIPMTEGIGGLSDITVIFDFIDIDFSMRPNLT